MTHHCTTYQISLITPLITKPLLTSRSSHHACGRRSTQSLLEELRRVAGAAQSLLEELPSCHSSPTTHHCTTYHISLITPVITTPLLTSHSSHHARGRRSTEPPGPRLPHSSLLHSHTISSGTPNLRVSPGRAQAHKWWPDSLHFAIFTTWWEGPFARQLTWGPVARQVYLRKSNRT